VLGGTFDPPHIGHLIVASEALWQLQLDEVRLVPARVPPHKPGPHLSAESRARCLERAVAGRPGLSVSQVELEREGPSYTADTLETMAADEPGVRLWFVLGADQLAELPGWHDPQRILSAARLAAVPRAGRGRKELEALARRVAPGLVDWLEVPEIGVSSTMIRERIAGGRPVRFLVPPEVEQALAEEGLVASAGENPTKGSLATSLELTLAAAALAESKNARDIVILDMRGLVAYTDYLLVCTGQTPRQTKAIAEEIRQRMKGDHGLLARKVEGEREGEWILLDFLDLVVHVFTPEARDFYRLDRLWREAPQRQYAATAS
jgi:nicotinate (nicotinamide) nucleotide adenylyltransferase/ribosome silencing factor RsfS/YbeB/iojap